MCIALSQLVCDNVLQQQQESDTQVTQQVCHLEHKTFLEEFYGGSSQQGKGTEYICPVASKYLPFPVHQSLPHRVLTVHLSSFHLSASCSCQESISHASQQFILLNVGNVLTKREETREVVQVNWKVPKLRPKLRVTNFAWGESHPNTYPAPCVN